MKIVVFFITARQTQFVAETAREFAWEELINHDNYNSTFKGETRMGKKSSSGNNKKVGTYNKYF